MLFEENDRFSGNFFKNNLKIMNKFIYLEMIDPSKSFESFLKKTNENLKNSLLLQKNRRKLDQISKNRVKKHRFARI